LVKDFLAENSVTTVEYPSYSPDLSAADFYLFSPLKSALKGRRFCDASDIIENATEELKSFHKIASIYVSNAFTVAGRSV
jgi:hypothetical protein